MEQTIRQSLTSLLRAGPLSAKEISGALHIPEKEVYGHLAHIEKSARQDGLHLVVRPSRCKACGFVFRKRTRLVKPGKCPICRETHVDEPLFALRGKEG